MRRVLVIGSGGAGKSTLALRIGERLGLPVIHLDRPYWRAGWIETPKHEWTTAVERVIAGDAWVIDGNYGGALAARLAACDTVVFLDLPRIVCAWRVVRRGRALHRHARRRGRSGRGERAIVMRRSARIRLLARRSRPRQPS